MCGDRTKKTLLTSYRNRCAYCGNPIRTKEMTVDHVHPKSRGGKSCIRNLKPSCRFCNMLKGNLDVEAFRKKVIHMLSTDLSAELSTDKKLCEKAKNKFALLNGSIKFFYETVEEEEQKLDDLLNFREVRC